MIILKRKFRKSKAYHSLSETVKVAGKKRCTFVIEGANIVTTDTAIPKNIKLIKRPNSFLFVAKNKTLTLNQFPPPIQIFKSSGKAEWWGKGN